MNITSKELLADEQYLILASLLSTSYYLEVIDNLKGTQYYKNNVKNTYAFNIVQGELSRKLDKEVPFICGVNDDTMHTVSDYIQEMMQEISSLRPEYVGVIAEIIKKFKNKPNEVMEYFQIQMS